MEAGHIAAGGLADVGRSTGRTKDRSQVRGRWLALIGGAAAVAFGGAFAAGAATSTKAVAPARLAPAIGSAQPAALKLAVKPALSVPTMVRVVKPKPKTKAKSATVASAPVVVAPVLSAPVVTRVAPVAVTPAARVPSTPSTIPSVPVTHPATPSTKSGSSGSGTVSGSG